MTTPENPGPQDPHAPEPEPDGDDQGEDERVDPHDALKGLEDRPRIDEHGYPTAYTAVPPPLYEQAQEQGQPQGHGQAQGQGQGEGGGGGEPGADRAARQDQGHGREQAQQPWQAPQPDQAGEQPPQWGNPPPYGQQPQYGPQPTGAQASYGAPNDQDPYGGRYPGYGHPPPPPGYNEPYGSPYGGGPVPGMPPFARWGQRAFAWLIDNILAVIGFALLDASYDDWNGGRGAAVAVTVVGVVWSVYNAYRAGRTGQSTGKRIAGIRLARYLDGQVVGPAIGVLRLFMNAVFWAICVIPGLLNYLWPLWDRKSQTWSDKITSSVVVRAR